MRWTLAILLAVFLAASAQAAPNILFILTDDQPLKGVSAYGSALASTPNIDRIATGGVKFTNAFVANPICTPSRATYLTGKYSNANGVFVIGDALDTGQQTFVDLLDANDYQTAIFGKWHVRTTPDNFGFDHYEICPLDNPCAYDDPDLDIDGTVTPNPGAYFTDLITANAVTWLDARDTTKPVFAMVTHFATHGPWIPACAAGATCAADDVIAQPATYGDAFATRAPPWLNISTQLFPGMFNQWNAVFAVLYNGKSTITGADDAEKKANTYQAFANDFIRVDVDLDEQIGVLLDYLEAEPCSPTPCSGSLADNTVIILTADNGLHVGDHGLREKHVSTEEATRVPMLIQYTGTIGAGTTRTEMVNNTDLAPTILDYAGIAIPTAMQGSTLTDVIAGSPPADWRTSIYFQFYGYEPFADVVEWYALRTSRYKLIYHYGKAWGGSQAWELIDLATDPSELTDIYGTSDAGLITSLKSQLYRHRSQIGIRSAIIGGGAQAGVRLK